MIPPGTSAAQLNLCDLTMADVPAFYHAGNDFDVVKMTGTFPWPFTVDFVEKRIERLTNLSPETGKAFALVAEGMFCGSIGLSLLPPAKLGPARYTLGYFLARAAWGKGFATQACLDVQTWASRALRKPMIIEAGHFIDNPASGRVLIKAGFIQTGEIKPVFCQSRGVDVPSVEYEWSIM